MKKSLSDYAYDIDKIEIGDKIPVICFNKKCNRFLVMEVVYPSVMQCHHKRFGSFDMRNQVWYCHQHKPK